MGTLEGISGVVNRVTNPRDEYDLAGTLQVEPGCAGDARAVAVFGSEWIRLAKRARQRGQADRGDRRGWKRIIEAERRLGERRRERRH